MADGTVREQVENDGGKDITQARRGVEHTLDDPGEYVSGMIV